MDAEQAKRYADNMRLVAFAHIRRAEFIEKARELVQYLRKAPFDFPEYHTRLLQELQGMSDKLLELDKKLFEHFDV
jgi:hypothetical protein